MSRAASWVGLGTSRREDLVAVGRGSLRQTSANRADVMGEASNFQVAAAIFGHSTVSVRSDTRMEAELKLQRRPRGCARSWRARRSSAAA
jgi:hypothetical protein